MQMTGSDIVDIFVLDMMAIIHFQCHGESGVYPGNIACEVGIHNGRNACPSCSHCVMFQTVGRNWGSQKKPIWTKTEHTNFHTATSLGLNQGCTVLHCLLAFLYFPSIVRHNRTTTEPPLTIYPNFSLSYGGLSLFLSFLNTYLSVLC